jgi:anti-sigma B factor antagonist
MSDFKINFRESSNINIVDLKGYLDAHTAPELEGAFQKLMSSNQYNIVVNFKNLSYISSAGLGVFMAYIEEVRKNNGDIKLANMSPKIFNVFDILGFPLLYEIYKDEKEALTKFTTKK